MKKKKEGEILQYSARIERRKLSVARKGEGEVKLIGSAVEGKGSYVTVQREREAEKISFLYYITKGEAKEGNHAGERKRGDEIT